MAIALTTTSRVPVEGKSSVCVICMKYRIIFYYHQPVSNSIIVYCTPHAHTHERAHARTHTRAHACARTRAHSRERLHTPTHIHTAVAVSLFGVAQP